MASDTTHAGGGTPLPDGTTCGDCRHIRRCTAMFGHTADDTYCDWAPSRFRAALQDQPHD